MKCFYSFLLLLFSGFINAGFIGDTLVKTPAGYVQITNLKVDDEIFGINRDGEVSLTTITHAVSYDCNQYMIVGIDEEEVILARGQKFFLPLKHIWRKAKKLHEKDVVLNAFYDGLTVRKLQTLHAPITFYEIRLKQDHAFLITKSDIIVHNCPLFGIGLLVTWGCGAVTVETVWAGICFAGLWLGSKMCGSSKTSKLFIEPKSRTCNYPVHALDQYQNDDAVFQPTIVPASDLLLHQEAKGDCLIVPSQHVPKKSCGSSTCKPPMPGPHGTHIPSPKHGPVPKGNIAAGLNMEEGQKALDVSVPVFDQNDEKKDQRVAVWKGQYIVFLPTDIENDIWHNHIRSWEKDKFNNQGLDQDMKKALKDANVVKGSKGKIIKDSKKSNKDKIL